MGCKCITWCNDLECEKTFAATELIKDAPGYIIFYKEDKLSKFCARISEIHGFMWSHL